MDINELRTELQARRGTWSAIAEKAGCNRKTIERIVHQDDYLPNLRTFNDLLRAMGEIDRPAPAAPTPQAPAEA